MNINRIFDEVRSLYFPRWDRQRRWSAKFGDAQQLRDGNTGYCDTDAKVIYLDERDLLGMPRHGVRAFLIHEICHDVGAARHNRAWASKMEEVAKHAESLNEPRIAELLRSDIFMEGGPGVLEDYDLPSVQYFAEELFGRNPSIDCDTAIRNVAKHFGHSSAKVRRDFDFLIKDVLAGRT